jgi:hypothetical protein
MKWMNAFWHNIVLQVRAKKIYTRFDLSQIQTRMQPLHEVIDHFILLFHVAWLSYLQDLGP